MLTIKNLSIKDNVFDYEMIHNLNFTLQENDKIAIIGSEGTGKSTLLKLLAGFPLNYIDYEGEVICHTKIVYVDQNISNRWNLYTLYEYFYKQDDIFRIQADLRKTLALFALDYNTIIDRHINTLSGGEKVKCALALAIARKPDILLLDEPSNDLDFQTIEFLENFMNHTQIPLFFISHDQRLLENVANGIIHLQHVHKQMLCKTFVYRGKYKDYKNLYFRKYESDLQIARKQRSDYQAKMKKFRQIYQKVEYQQNQAVRNPELARLLKKKIKSLKSQESRFLKEKETWIDIPELEEPMHIFFDGESKINHKKRIIEIDINHFLLPNHNTIERIYLNLRGNEACVIYGQNGVGKSTLIKAIIKYLDRQGIHYAYIPQDYMELLERGMSVIEYLNKNQSKYPDYRIRQILGQLGFKRDEMEAKCEDLSEGQKLKILLLLMVSIESEIIILDEPTRNISPINQDEIYDLFLQYQGAILAVSHDRLFIESVFDRIFELREDALVEI